MIEDLKPLLVPLLVAAISISLTAYITIKVKFAASEEAAFRSIKNGVFKIFQYGLDLIIIGLLIREAISDEPVTRALVFTVSIYFSAIVFSILMGLIARIIGLIEHLNSVQKAHLDLSKDLVDVARTVADERPSKTKSPALGGASPSSPEKS